MEIADIIPASARNFVFKYHGDLGDAESIILSREQYRQIKNDYPGTLRALSTLLATRPVLIIGFGLQDPDFFLVQDELVSIFQGQAGEYFAIQPDFDDLRINYWRKNYRTEVISYDTVPKPDGTRDHSQMLALIQELRSDKFRRNLYRARSPGRMPPGHLLLLARLAASVARQRPAPLEVSFPLSVELEINPKSGFRPHPGQLKDLLRLHEGSFLLLGDPGAGKSFTLKEYAADLADALTRRCLSDTGDTDEPHVPIFVDLTLYRGNMGELIQTMLPVGLELSNIFPGHRCTVVLDAANEMPREYIENERWVHDFTQLQTRFPEARFLIGCRNEAWVKAIDLPIFIIREIDSKFVKKQLSGIVSHEALGNPALTQALSTPLLFSLVKTGRMVIQEALTPSGLYEAYWAKLNAKWTETTGETVDFVSALENVAYSMLENGIEYAPKVDFERALSAQFRRAEVPLTALLRDGTLVPLSGQRVSFFHQCLTEQLAAGVIAKQFEANPATLKALLRDKRWDQALFLAAGSLRPALGKEFIRKILDTDIAAGARAAYYIRREQAEVIDSILQQAIYRGTDDFDQALDLSLILKDLPYNYSNVARLRVLAEQDDLLGGVAAGVLFSICPRDRRKIIAASFSRHEDYNYISNYIDASVDIWTKRHIYFFFEKLSGPSHVMTDALSSYSTLVSRLPEKDLPQFCQRFLGTSPACRWIIAQGLKDLDNPFATTVLKELVRNGEQEAFYLFYSHLRFQRSTLNLKELPVDNVLVRSIFNALSTSKARWAVEAGQQLVRRNKEWAGAFRKLALEEITDRQIMAEVIAAEAPHREQPIRAALKRMSELSSHEIAAIGHDDFWQTASAEILVEALETRVSTLVDDLPLYLRTWNEDFPILRKHGLDWWLDWIEECSGGQCGNSIGTAYVLQQILLKGSKVGRQQLLNRFNEGLSEDFWRIGCCVFCGSENVSTDEFSDAANRLLMAEADNRPWIAQLLGEAATEEFVVSELLPLLEGREPRRWLVETLRATGRRHNRRYMV